jgi:putative membrane protein insertion efficiency factor
VSGVGSTEPLRSSSGVGSTEPTRNGHAGAARAGAGTYLGIGLVYAWRYTFGLLTPPGTCKYHPSCSQYALDAIRKHGLLKGSAKAAWRLLRCNPWSHGGVDFA